MKKAWGATRSARVVATGLCGLLVAGTVISGCGSSTRATGTEPVGNVPVSVVTPRDAPAKLFGQWRLVRTSGGITGSGYPVTPGTGFLSFDNSGTFFRVVNGKSVQGTYQVSVRQTIFSTSNLPVILYSNTSLTNASLVDVITQVNDAQLVISEEAPDGYVREYERIVTAF